MGSPARRRALTRHVARTIPHCELTFIDRQPIDYTRATAQHRAYRSTLAACGLDVLLLDADDRFPDCCFIEDTALVLDELAVIMRCGAPSRRGEVAAVRDALAPYRALHELAPPATMDGGDLVRIGSQIFVGRSPRTNDEAIASLRSLVEPFGYRVSGVDVRGALHLKTACTPIGDQTLLINRAWLDLAPLAGYELVDVPPSEPYAADVLRIDDRVLAHSGHPATRALLEARGIEVVATDVSEFLKAEGGVTCLSLIV